MKSIENSVGYTHSTTINAHDGVYMGEWNKGLTNLLNIQGFSLLYYTQESGNVRGGRFGRFIAGYKHNSQYYLLVSSNNAGFLLELWQGLLVDGKVLPVSQVMAIKKIAYNATGFSQMKDTLAARLATTNSRFNAIIGNARATWLNSVQAKAICDSVQFERSRILGNNELADLSLLQRPVTRLELLVQLADILLWGNGQTARGRKLRGTKAPRYWLGLAKALRENCLEN